jgi:two-component system, chemotaxis family, CheB/CheR fusion protein
MAVHAMKAGALDFIEKPVDNSELVSGVERALKISRDSSDLLARRKAAASRIAMLTPRERQIMDLVVAGHASKNIAADLCVSQRTVENHRNAIMKKTGSKSLPALARLALTAAWPPFVESAAPEMPGSARR